MRLFFCHLFIYNDLIFAIYCYFSYYINNVSSSFQDKNRGEKNVSST